jgi:hypothetical protein
MHPEQSDRTRIGLRGLVLWLGVGTLLWYRLIGWPPPALPALPATLPSWAMVDVWVRSPLATDWTGFVAAIGLGGWAFWAWAWLSVLLEVAVNLADAATHQSPWVTAIRCAVRPLTVPFIRRIVDASLGGLLLARVALQPVVADAAVAWHAEVAAVTPSDGYSAASFSRGFQSRASFTGELRAAQQSGSDTGGQQAAHEVLYHVQPGDSLWAIARRFYDDGEKETLLFDANVGRLQFDGRALTRHAVIYPSWILRVPEPTQGLDVDAGEWWYTVQAGDTLSGISARFLGNPTRCDEIFQSNRGGQAPDGHVLLDPDLIWPGLRLRLPLDDAVEPAADSAPTPPPAMVPRAAAEPEPDRQDHGLAEEKTPTPRVSPTAVATTALTPAPVATAATAQAPPTMGVPPTIQPVEPVRPESSQSVPPAAAALGAAGLAAAALAASQLVVYKRKAGRDPDEAESDVSIQDGFAEVDPMENLARRMAHTSDPASTIASLLGQAYAAIFDEVLQLDERCEICDVTVAATRHGRSSTTLVLAAPVAARPYLVHHMRAAAERAFGDRVDVDGKVDQDGDVLVRVTWDARQPISGDLLEHANDTSARCAWPAPCLVPALDFYDRQRMALNWHTLSGVLIASPTGQGADVPLVSLVAALASLRAPQDLGLVVVARPHTLPDEIGLFAHGLLDVADPGDAEAVLHALQSVKLEVDRRRQSGSSDNADVVVVVRELGDLETQAMAVCGAITASGPGHGVRLVAASERPVAELLSSCPFIDRLGTRLVLQTASEEDSVALLGTDGAEQLGAGGHALLRFEGRMPHPGRAHRVSADRLAGVLHMMGTRTPTAPASSEEPAAAQPEDAVDSEKSPDIAENGTEESDEDDIKETSVPVVGQVADNEPARPTTTPRWASSRLQELRAAPIRVRCFGACDVWHGERLLKIGNPQLLLLLAVHPVAGINSETLADMLWDDVRPDPGGDLRKERSKLRLKLRQLVPDLPADPLPGDAYKGEKVVTLDTTVVSSDVHEFTELLDLAGRLPPGDAIEAYDAALRLYKGDLLDASDMRKYRWMYDDDPQIAVMKRAEFRSMCTEARLSLAALLAEGPESGWARAEELYSGLCGEDVDNEHLWSALFRIYEREGNSLGLERAVRRFRGAQIEIGTGDVTDTDRVPLPPNLERLVQQIRQRIGSRSVEPAAGGDSA